MSLDNENVSDTNLEKLDEITNKLNRCNKNVKLVLELLEKLSKASETKKQGGGYVEKGSAEYKNKKTSVSYEIEQQRDTATTTRDIKFL